MLGSGPGLTRDRVGDLKLRENIFSLDSLGKVIRFQQQVRLELGLKNIVSVHSRGRISARRKI